MTCATLSEYKADLGRTSSRAYLDVQAGKPLLHGVGVVCRGAESVVGARAMRAMRAMTKFKLRQVQGPLENGS